MILLTFDDAINSDNNEIYSKILNSKRKNPNGCSIKATFFVSHQFNNYQQTQKMWNHGHEIAVHSVTYINNPRAAEKHLLFINNILATEDQQNGGLIMHLSRTTLMKWWAKPISCTSMPK